MKIFFLVILLILFIGDMANAQCAWVLWKKVSEGALDLNAKWELENAVPTYNMCLDLLVDRVESIKAMWADDPDYTILAFFSSVTLRNKSKRHSTYFNFQCFPDTIDPRK